MKRSNLDPWVIIVPLLAAMAISTILLGLSTGADAATIIVPDDYGTIQEAIDNASIGDTIRIHAGTYSEAVVVDKAVALVGNGTAVTIVVGTSDDTISVTGGGARIESLQVQGGLKAGIALRSDGNVVEGVYCTANYRGVGIWSGDNNYVGNSTLTGNSYAGAGVHTQADWNRFYNNTCDLNTEFGIAIGASANNTFDRGTVSNNTNQNGVNSVNFALDNRYSNLVIDGNGGYGIYLSGASGTKITDCVVSGNGNNGLQMESLSRAKVEDTLIRRNAQNGIYANGCSDMTFLRTMVMENRFGTFFLSCNGIEFGWGSVSDNDGYGLGIQNSGASKMNRYHNNSIEMNALVTVGQFDGGVTMGGAAPTTSNYIEDNAITGNNKGIVVLLTTTSGNVFRRNVIEGNAVVGVDYQLTPGANTFYHNDFVGNPTHVASPNAGDVYDNGYPWGGNYWDVYTGRDVMRGPAQDTIGPDGLGDTPYQVSPGVLDNYPLMAAFDSASDSIMIVSPPEGGLVGGVVLVEAVVISDVVVSVDFYVGTTKVGTDSAWPYQHVLDTTTLPEDQTVDISAAAMRLRGDPIIATVRVTVNNQVQMGAFIKVTTQASEYRPDQRVTAHVELLVPQGSDEARLRASYTDADGNVTHLPELVYPPGPKYGFTFWLPSDVPTGNLELRVTLMGHMGGMRVWEATNSTTVSVSGLSYHEEMAALLDALSDLSSDVAGLNATTQAQLAQLLADVLSAMDTIGADIGVTLEALWADYNATADADLNSTLTAMRAMWDGINATALQGFADVVGNITQLRSDIATDLAVLQAYLDGEIDLSQQQLQARVTSLWSGLNTTLAGTESALHDHLQDLEDAMADGSTALQEYLALRADQLELYMYLVNASLHLHMDAIEDAVSDFQGDAMADLADLADAIEVMESNDTERIGMLMEAIDETYDLVEGLNSTSIEDLRTRLLALRDDLGALNTTEGDRHAGTVDALLVRLAEMDREVSDRMNQTDVSLEALSTLDTIRQELDRLSSDVADTQDAVSEDQGGVMGIFFLLLVLMLVSVAFLALVFMRLRSEGPPPPEPRREEMEAVEPAVYTPEAPVEAPMEAPPEAPPEEPPEEPRPEGRFELSFEEPIMEPPAEPQLMVAPIEAPPAEAPPEPAPSPSGRKMTDWVLEEIIEEIEPARDMDDSEGLEAFDIEETPEEALPEEPEEEVLEEPSEEALEELPVEPPEELMEEVLEEVPEAEVTEDLEMIEEPGPTDEPGPEEELEDLGELEELEELEELPPPEEPEEPEK